jgi:hypothetical protein
MAYTSVWPDKDAHSTCLAGMYRRAKRHIENIRVAGDESDCLSISSSVPDLCNPQSYLFFKESRIGF